MPEVNLYTILFLQRLDQFFFVFFRHDSRAAGNHRFGERHWGLQRIGRSKQVSWRLADQTVWVEELCSRGVMFTVHCNWIWLSYRNSPSVDLCSLSLNNIDFQFQVTRWTGEYVANTNGNEAGVRWQLALQTQRKIWKQHSKSFRIGSSGWREVSVSGSIAGKWTNSLTHHTDHWKLNVRPVSWRTHFWIVWKHLTSRPFTI